MCTKTELCYIFKKMTNKDNQKEAVIILCRPEESRNIGSVCRAMKNMDIHTLRIVGKKSDYDEEKVSVLSVHAFDIWQKAVFFDSITEACADCAWVCGTTRRRGKNRKDWLLLPEEFAARYSALLQGKVAIVFGNERTGLTDEELAECNSGVIIPSNGRDGSLNLSHAVQILCYTVFRAEHKISDGYTPVTQERLSKTVTAIGDNLQKMGFFSVTGRPDMELFWRSVLSRAALSESEARYIEKTFTKAAGLFKKNQAEEEQTET